MKRLILCSLLFACLFSLFSCGLTENAQNCKNLIEGIGEISLDSEKAIIEAENAYDILNDEEKASISKIAEKLFESRSAYNECVIISHIDNVNSIINAIGTVSLESESAILSAEEAFASLTDEEKKRNIVMADKLAERRSAYEDLVIQNKINKVLELIQSIGTVTLDSDDAISKAEEAYSQLSSIEQERMKDGFIDLQNYRVTYQNLVIQARIDNVQSLIDAVGKITANSDSKIKKAEKAYNELSKEEQAAAPQLKSALETLRKDYNTMKAEADKVIKEINAIGTVSLNSKESIYKARVMYDLLSEQGKTFVSNLNTLTNAETKYAALSKDYNQKIIDNFLPVFNVDYDPFSGTTCYQHVSLPRYINTRSYILPEIYSINGTPFLGITFNYTGKKWVFWKKLIILVDDKKYIISVKYSDITHDNGNGVWEYYEKLTNPLLNLQDEEIDYFELLDAISNSQTTSVRFKGDERDFDLTISENDKTIIRETLTLYNALFSQTEYASTYDYMITLTPYLDK